MAEELEKFGVSLEIKEDAVTIRKQILQTPNAILNGHNDHRIVMSCTVLCSITGGTINGAEAVCKSFPDFFDRIRKLGLEVEEV
jgi:3-phosphoshikimate 1-carboxyvinyltransferase